MSNSDNQAARFIQFRLGGKKYAIDINFMEEVMNLQEIMEIPDTPQHVKGVTRYRTEVIPVVCIKKKLGLPDTGHDADTKILIVKYKEENIGILIDQLIGALYELEPGHEAGRGINLLTLKDVLG